MHLLVLGGTWFVGHAIVKAAIDAGWEVTTFNRGTSDPFLKAARPFGETALARKISLA